MTTASPDDEDELIVMDNAQKWHHDGKQLEKMGNPVKLATDTALSEILSEAKKQAFFKKKTLLELLRVCFVSGT